jgi:hypothetical protein
MKKFLYARESIPKDIIKGRILSGLSKSQIFSVLEGNSMSNQPKEKYYPKPMSSSALVFWTGLFGGMFWGTIGYFSYLIGLTEIRPNVILEPWALGYWKNEGLGTLISIIFIGIISVPVAYIYYGVLKKLNGFWAGLSYGLVLLLLVFFVLNPIFPSIKPISEMTRDTIITSVCLYLIYGLFIGYSISYDYENLKGNEKETAS